MVVQEREDEAWTRAVKFFLNDPEDTVMVFSDGLLPTQHPNPYYLLFLCTF